MPNVLDAQLELNCAAEETRSRRALVRARESLGEACGPCPERDGVLRRQLACRCPVALALRLLQVAERRGGEVSGLTASERASLDFQERALARKLPPFEQPALDRARHHLSGGHSPCAGEGCLACRAAHVLEMLADREAAGGGGR